MSYYTSAYGHEGPQKDIDQSPAAAATAAAAGEEAGRLLMWRVRQVD